MLECQHCISLFKKGQKNEKGNEKYVPLWRMGKDEKGRESNVEEKGQVKGK